MELPVLTHHSYPPGAERIAEVEALVGPLPVGYAPFVEHWGGAEVDDFVRVYSPARILEDLAEFRERWDEYWFWSSPDPAAPSQALASKLVIVADSFNGDEVVYLEGAPDRLWFLHRNEDEIVPLGSTFDQAIALVCAWRRSDFVNATLDPATTPEASAVTYRDGYA